MAATTGAPTLVPSNLIVGNQKLENNPNWVPNAMSEPQANILTEDGNSRIMIVAGRHPKVSSQDRPVGGLGYTSAFSDGAYNEETATFRFTNINVQQCTALQLETVNLYFPGVAPAAPGQRNLTQNYCGQFISDDFVNPRRVSLNQIDMQIPFLLRNRILHFSMEGHLPNGRNISYYTIDQLFTFLIQAWTDYMKNIIGDSTFFATVYIDAIGPRLYWTSSTYGLNNIRLYIADFESRMPNFLNLIMNFVGFTDVRVGDTSQTSRGYADGESVGFFARAETSLQNNTTTMTVHCNELTQFRKSDSIAPIEGTSIIGACTPPLLIGGGTAGGTYVFSKELGTLVSPKVAFDRNQTTTEFFVTFRVFQGNQGQVVTLNSTELHQATCTLTFRLW